MPKRIATGEVTSDRGASTRTVEIARLVKHPLYGKYVRRKTVCFVHDENNESAIGDRVEIVECRPRSKAKRWELVRIVEKSRAVSLADLKEAQRQAAEQQTAEPAAAGQDQGDSEGSQS